MIDKFNIKTKTKLREEIKYEFDNSKIQVSVHKIISKDNRPNEDQKYEDYYKMWLNEKYGGLNNHFFL